MTPEDVVQRAREKVEEQRKSIISAVAESWCIECLDLLKDVTGLSLDSRPKYEVEFPSVEDGPQFSFNASGLWDHAKQLVDNGRNTLETASSELATFYLGQLPPPNNPRDFDHWGRYVPGSPVVCDRVEIYWAKIATSVVAELAAIVPRAKVIMLHQLAHFVTHKGSYAGKSWSGFPTGKDAAEVVAQAATEAAIELHRKRHQDDTLGIALQETFKQLLAIATSPACSAHQNYIRRLENINSSDGAFWKFFRRKIQGDVRITTLAEIESLIKTDEALRKGKELHGLDLTF